MPELAMLQSFYSGPTCREGVLNEKPRPVCAGGVLESCVVPVPTAHCRRPPPHARRPLRQVAQFLVGSQSAWKGSLGTLSVYGLTGFIQAQLFRHDNGKFFICTKMRRRSRFARCRRWPAKQKTPPERGFYQRYAVGCRKAHCVISTSEVYAFREEHAISARILTHLSMDQKSRSVHKILFIHTVFIYNITVRNVL
ncbi:hypothetical protein CKO_00012 [Citrobacter koseri ATCC BAA-895]|uniref:Uncharacterized protein n=1 Tax=Citrobacter koseri (strain ATCC BAA-895 / CDC 4225-83 / SGSC4696) TaxID=290338 RepID=A8ACH9_CITK8|nr:hypothetical protein CKO_00012 [Citrobacter koseri ATCC BAA-895]